MTVMTMVFLGLSIISSFLILESEIGEYLTFCVVGGIHLHETEVLEIVLILGVCVSAAKSKAAMCEHPSPSPAIQVQ